MLVDILSTMLALIKVIRSDNNIQLCKYTKVIYEINEQQRQNSASSQFDKRYTMWYSVRVACAFCNDNVFVVVVVVVQ